MCLAIPAQICRSVCRSIVCITRRYSIRINSIPFDLCSAFSNGHCHRGALQNYINSRYTFYILKFTPNEQVSGEGAEEKDVETVWGRTFKKNKREPVLIWVTPDNAIINNPLLICVLYSPKVFIVLTGTFIYCSFNVKSIVLKRSDELWGLKHTDVLHQFT